MLSILPACVHRAREVFRLCGDNTLITSLTDWRPRYDLEAGLRETVEWFTKPENLAKYKSGIYNV